MNYSEISVVFQEIPGEISICFTITGCKINCKGCHSPFLWNEKNGKELTAEIYKETLLKYKGFATAVLFMGGEWHEEELTKILANEDIDENVKQAYASDTLFRF